MGHKEAKTRRCSIFSKQDGDTTEMAAKERPQAASYRKLGEDERISLLRLFFCRLSFFYLPSPRINPKTRKAESNGEKIHLRV